MNRFTLTQLKAKLANSEASVPIKKSMKNMTKAELVDKLSGAKSKGYHKGSSQSTDAWSKMFKAFERPKYRGDVNKSGTDFKPDPVYADSEFEAFDPNIMSAADEMSGIPLPPKPSGLRKAKKAKVKPLKKAKPKPKAKTHKTRGRTQDRVGEPGASKRKISVESTDAWSYPDGTTPGQKVAKNSVTEGGRRKRRGGRKLGKQIKSYTARKKKKLKKKANTGINKAYKKVDHGLNKAFAAPGKAKKKIKKLPSKAFKKMGYVKKKKQKTGGKALSKAELDKLIKSFK